MKQVIVNADDPGLTPGVNRGIVGRTAKDRHSTSVMITLPDAPAGLSWR